jgi:SAM-dependent methyltransferase
MPWFFKIPVKIVLSRLPVRGRMWQRMNVFRAGRMDDPRIAFEAFQTHYRASGIPSLAESSVLEIGPGNGLLSALYARAFGANQTWLIDAEELAIPNIDAFANAGSMLRQLGLSVPAIQYDGSVEGILKQLNAEYLTNGLQAFQKIPDHSIDFLFSNAVLEHIRLAEFVPLVQEMKRVLKPTGMASHQIDFRDHLQFALNNLRFSEKTWESHFMSTSGFYTNRIPWIKMKAIFEDAGFSVIVKQVDRWSSLPTPQKSMSEPFRSMPAADLVTWSCHVVLRPQ